MDPPLELVNAIGISGNVASSLLLHEADDAAHIVYPLGSTLVIRNVEDASDQIFLRGVWPHPLITGAHTRPSSGDCWHVMSKLTASLAGGSRRRERRPPPELSASAFAATSSGLPLLYTPSPQHRHTSPPPRASNSTHASDLVRHDEC